LSEVQFLREAWASNRKEYVMACGTCKTATKAAAPKAPAKKTPAKKTPAKKK
jgi:hypothetical protein